MSHDLYRTIATFLNKCRLERKKPLLVILGPTASGKTALSIEIAREFNSEIISADSRQVYKYMDIGTDKILPGEREGISHYLIDVVTPNERFTVADFKLQAEKIIDDILGRAALPMVVGGTGLYIRTLVRNFSLPPENRAIRTKLNEDLKKIGSRGLHTRLAKLDPENASKIHPNNSPYIVRALEILEVAGKPKNAEQKPSRYECLQIGLRWPREILFERIHRRVDKQFERGFTIEVQNLLKMGFSKNLPAMNSLGYQEVIKYLEGALSLEETKKLIKQRTRNFAKRQETWFKRDPDILWYNAADVCIG